LAISVSAWSVLFFLKGLLQKWHGLIET
jgi:hypothetical protein